MAVAVEHCSFARKLGAFVSLTLPEHDTISGLLSKRKTFSAGAEVIYQGEAQNRVYVVSRGWVCSYKILRGGTRQILGFDIPGDFIGLRSLLFRSSDYNAAPVTEVEASEISSSEILRLFNTNPRLGTAFLWAASRDEAMVVEHLISIGRRDALERTVHFLLELGARLLLVGIGTQEGYSCPLSQTLLADALGLSSVHVNRVLRQLREENLLTFREGHVAFLNVNALVSLSGFDLNYLDQSGPLLRQ